MWTVISNVLWDELGDPGNLVFIYLIDGEEGILCTRMCGRNSE